MKRLLSLAGPQVAPTQRLINFNLFWLQYSGCSAELAIGEASGDPAVTFQEPSWLLLLHHLTLGDFHVHA